MWAQELGHMGLAALWPEGVFLGQGLNLCLLHWQLDSPLHWQRISLWTTGKALCAFVFSLAVCVGLCLSPN